MRPHRLQTVTSERSVDLRTQVADVDLDDVVVALEVDAPHLGKQHALGRDPAVRRARATRRSSSRVVRTTSLGPRKIGA